MEELRQFEDVELRDCDEELVANVDSLALPEEARESVLSADWEAEPLRDRVDVDSGLIDSGAVLLGIDGACVTVCVIVSCADWVTDELVLWEALPLGLHDGNEERPATSQRVQPGQGSGAALEGGQ
jgi:hypothetical protein